METSWTLKVWLLSLVGKAVDDFPRALFNPKVFLRLTSGVCFQKVLIPEHKFYASNPIPLEMETLPDNFTHVDSLRPHINMLAILNFPIIAD